MVNLILRRRGGLSRFGKLISSLSPQSGMVRD